MTKHFFRKSIVKRWNLLVNPSKGFQEYSKLSFESAIHEYLILLLTVAVMVGVATFLTSVGKALIFDILFQIDINYWNMLNYSLGRANGLIFLYFFSGTFLLFLLSVVLNLFFKKIKYTRLLQILFIALTPYLIFGWIYVFIPALLIWSIFLFAIGIKMFMAESTIDNKSIRQRD